jgi:DNA-binding GntR family transcriptional regulator
MTTRSKDEPATTKPAVDRAVEQIAELIISGEYKPGQRITELPLARRLGMGSRTTTRSALARLADQGLVTLEQNKGAIVTPLDAAEWVQLSAVQIALARLVLADSFLALAPRDFATLGGDQQDRLLVATERLEEPDPHVQPRTRFTSCHSSTRRTSARWCSKSRRRGGRSPAR